MKQRLAVDNLGRGAKLKVKERKPTARCSPMRKSRLDEGGAAVGASDSKRDAEAQMLRYVKLQGEWEISGGMAAFSPQLLLLPEQTALKLRSSAESMVRWCHQC